MLAWAKGLGDESARRAWIGVGAPIFVLVALIIALAIAALAAFARIQDEGYAESTQGLVASATQNRGRSIATITLDYANWDAAFQNITSRWDPEWIEGNIYSSVSDGMLIFRADGSIRHAWFNERYSGESETLQHSIADAASSIPNLRRLPRAATVAETAAHTYALSNGRLLIIGIAPVTPEDQALRVAPGRRGVDFIASVDVVEAEELARVGQTLDLQQFRFVAGSALPPPGSVAHGLAAADGDAVGGLLWAHAHPGGQAFANLVLPVVLGLLGIGMLTVMVSRRLVMSQIDTMSRAEAALESSREKSEFLTRVSHELRTPLNAVIGYAEIIQEDPKSPDVREDATRILEAARHLGHLLGDIIDQSRIDAGSVRLVPEVLPVAGILAELQGLMRPAARKAEIELKSAHDASAGYILADHTRLRQCLLNVMSNAIKFSPRGSVVRLGAYLDRRDGGDMVVFSVHDQGIGIAANEIAKIFRPFGQANDNIGQRYGGAGIGLSIAQNLARQMGGDISVVSAPGEGSTFSVSVPAASASALAAA